MFFKWLARSPGANVGHDVSGIHRCGFAAVVGAVALSACGAPSTTATLTPSAGTPTPVTTATAVPTPVPQPTSAIVAPAAVLLSVDDFAAGSVDETTPSAQTPPGCAPGSPAGFVEAAGTRITDATGFNWSNVVFSFDKAADAHAFATAYFAAAGNCATGSGARSDVLGDYSFNYTQKGYAGGFGSATVEVVQVAYLVTMVLDGPNLGPNAPASELATVERDSVSELTRAVG
jgi:hypothetical protein